MVILLKIKRRDVLFFSEIAFLLWCHAPLKLRKFKLLYFEKKYAVGLETCTKIFFVYLQPGVNKNW